MQQAQAYCHSKRVLYATLQNDCALGSCRPQAVMAATVVFASHQVLLHSMFQCKLTSSHGHLVSWQSRLCHTRDLSREKLCFSVHLSRAMQPSRAGRSGRAQLLVASLPTMQSLVGAHSLALQLNRNLKCVWSYDSSTAMYGTYTKRISRISQGLMNVIGEHRSCMYGA